MQDSEQNRAALAVGVVPLPRFTLNAFASFVDALRLAADDRDRSRPIRCRWEVMSENGRAVPASCGINITASAPLTDPAQFDYIVVVGGILDHDASQEDPVVDYLRRAEKAHVPLVGICTGVFTMIRAGLMHGRRCCVSWLHYQDLLESADDVVPDSSRLFVVDGNRITCAGGVGSARLAAWMIERHLGRDLAQKALNVMMVDGQRVAGAAQPQPPVALDVKNPRVARAVLLVEENLSSPPTIGRVAADVNISRRQLERGFREELGMSYGDFSRRLRLDHGLWLVLTTDRPILDITLECGFNGQSHFATLFRKCFGLSPTAARNLSRLERDRLLERGLRFKPRGVLDHAARKRATAAE